MKINVNRLSADVELLRVLREIAAQLNALSEGSIAANYNAATAAPTTGTWSKGDFLTNSNPSELGSAGSKYFIKGWKCLASGSPGTWVQARYLTGN